MANNKGKAFEQKLREDFLKIPGSSIDRLYDPVGGLHGINNICDFIGYVFPCIYYLECKSIQGNTFPLKNLKQFDKLKSKKFIKGVRAGVVIWYINHDRVIYVPIITFEKIKNDGLKSIGIKTIDRDKYFILDIPSVKKRVFMDSDYSVLGTIPEDEEIDLYGK